jgi:hypothetical protein
MFSQFISASAASFAKSNIAFIVILSRFSPTNSGEMSTLPYHIWDDQFWMLRVAFAYVTLHKATPQADDRKILF